MSAGGREHAAPTNVVRVLREATAGSVAAVGPIVVTAGARFNRG